MAKRSLLDWDGAGFAVAGAFSAAPTASVVLGLISAQTRHAPRGAGRLGSGLRGFRRIAPVDAIWALDGATNVWGTSRAENADN